MERFIMFLENGKITIQKSEYIDDGWYIEIIGNIITLYEIPLFGGDVQVIGEFGTLIDAINKGNNLT